MAIDSNMFGFWNDVAGKPASGSSRLRPLARSEQQELRLQHLDLVACDERGVTKRGGSLAVHPMGNLAAGQAERRVAGKLVNSPRAST